MNKQTSLVLAKCVLREWRESDHTSLVENANNPNVARNLRDIFPSPYTLQHAYEWLTCVQELPPGSNLAIDVGGDAVGGIGLRFERNDEAEIGFWLGEPYWSHGIMTEALSAFTRHAFQTFTLQTIHASVFPWNTASCRVFEKSGYTNEGQITPSAKGDQKFSSFRFSVRRSRVLK